MGKNEERQNVISNVESKFSHDFKTWEDQQIAKDISSPQSSNNSVALTTTESS